MRRWCDQWLGFPCPIRRGIFVSQVQELFIRRWSSFKFSWNRLIIMQKTVFLTKDKPHSREHSFCITTIAMQSCAGLYRVRRSRVLHIIFMTVESSIWRAPSFAENSISLPLSHSQIGWRPRRGKEWYYHANNLGGLSVSALLRPSLWGSLLGSRRIQSWSILGFSEACSHWGSEKARKNAS